MAYISYFHVLICVQLVSMSYYCLIKEGSVPVADAMHIGNYCAYRGRCRRSGRRFAYRTSSSCACQRRNKIFAAPIAMNVRVGTNDIDDCEQCIHMYVDAPVWSVMQRRAPVSDADTVQRSRAHTVEVAMHASLITGSAGKHELELTVRDNIDATCSAPLSDGPVLGRIKATYDI